MSEPACVKTNYNFQTFENVRLKLERFALGNTHAFFRQKIHVPTSSDIMDFLLTYTSFFSKPIRTASDRAYIFRARRSENDVATAFYMTKDHLTAL